MAAQAIKMRCSVKDSRKRYKRETEADRKGKKTGRWSRTEHMRFIQAIKIYGTEDHLKLQEHIGTRTGKQIRSHQQKYFEKLQTVMGRIPSLEEIVKLEGLEKEDGD
jgi:SHAQKYF class myb-like DNA-binding protein